MAVRSGDDRQVRHRLLQRLALARRHFSWDNDPANTMAYDSVGIAIVRLGGPSIHNHNKGETMSKRPPLGTTGKLALAGNRNRARQLLDREQRERDLRDLLSLVGKNSSSCTSR